MREELFKHGAFSWTELLTTDVEESKKFYHEVFGWEFKQFDGSEMPYTVIVANGEEVGGIMDMPPNLPPGVPPHWGNYVTVDDIDKTVEKVKELGGNIFFGPMDVPNVGRFAVIQDPKGAVIMAISYKPM